MKTLKITAMLFAGLLIANTSSAQKGAYANFNFGYNFSLNSDVIGTETSDVTTVNNLGFSETRVEQANVTGSFGKGMTFGGTFGMMFSDNVGAELGINYLLGGTIETTNNSTYSDASNPSNNYNSNNTSKWSATMIQFNPTMVISAGKSEGFNPYGKFGIVIGSGTIKIEDEDIRTGSGARKEESEQEYNEGIALGWSAAFGATYNFSEKMGLFGELNMINMSYAPSNGKYTKFTTDGVDELATATTNQKEVEFKDNITDIYPSTPSGDEPRRELKTNYSFSSLGIKIGLRFQF